MRVERDAHVGWRNWRWELSRDRLWSPFFHGEEWQPMQRFERICAEESLFEHVGPPGLPTKECSCGIYVQDDRARAEEDYEQLLAKAPVVGGRVLVFGRCSIWGRTIEHELGRRGRFAYPYEIVVPRTIGDAERTAARIREEYAIDAFVA